jgi:uncharacterized protein YjbI with pentapeptide repeats
MPELTADAVLAMIKAGEKVERADLRGIALPKAVLEGASFRRCDLDGANLEGARLGKAILRNTSLREAYLASADLREANLENADLEGANLQNANLTGANLHRANLEGANLQGAKLGGARLAYAQLESANLGGANLTKAILQHADLVEADLSTATLTEADLTSADLAQANLEEAKLDRAVLRDAKLRQANLRKAKLKAAILTNADLSEANLSDAELEGADLRRANLTRARIEGALVNAVKIDGLVGTGAPVRRLRADWIDASIEGDGSKKVTGEEILTLLAGRVETPIAPPVPGRRYFGDGDVLRNATLEFGAGATVEVESLFEHCTITLGEGTELVVGKNGTLRGCQVRGAGKLTVHGTFIERESPGVVGITELVVSAEGALVGAVAQHPDSTRFSFEPGCMLRMKILKPSARDTGVTGRTREEMPE